MQYIDFSKHDKSYKQYCENELKHFMYKNNRYQPLFKLIAVEDRHDNDVFKAIADFITKYQHDEIEPDTIFTHVSDNIEDFSGLRVMTALTQYGITYTDIYYFCEEHGVRIDDDDTMYRACVVMYVQQVLLPQFVDQLQDLYNKWLKK